MWSCGHLLFARARCPSNNFSNSSRSVMSNSTRLACVGQDQDWFVVSAGRFDIRSIFGGTRAGKSLRTFTAQTGQFGRRDIRGSITTVASVCFPTHKRTMSTRPVSILNFDGTFSDVKLAQHNTKSICHEPDFVNGFQEHSIELQALCQLSAPLFLAKASPFDCCKEIAQEVSPFVNF